MAGGRGSCPIQPPLVGWVASQHKLVGVQVEPTVTQKEVSTTWILAAHTHRAAAGCRPHAERRTREPSFLEAVCNPAGALQPDGWGHLGCFSSLLWLMTGKWLYLSLPQVLF